MRFISRLLACSSVEYQFLYYVVRKVENKTKISNYETSWFNPRGQKGLICTRDNFTMARRGKKAGFAHVNLLSCAKWAVLHTWVGTPLIIVEFYVVITDTIAGFAASYRPYATSAVSQPRLTWPGRGHGGFCKSLTIRYHFKRSVETQTFFWPRFHTPFYN